MLAAVLHGPEDLRVQEVEIPHLAEGEVLLRSRAAAICGTDMRIFRHGHSRLPAGTKRVLGHELAGEIAEFGKGVTGIAEGARVSVAPSFGCGSCRMCQRGRHHLCPEYGAIGLTLRRQPECSDPGVRESRRSMVTGTMTRPRC
jgi:threonine dehydrogenase-like Zn-dependent dehydrogenase